MLRRFAPQVPDLNAGLGDSIVDPYLSPGWQPRHPLFDAPSKREDLMDWNAYDVEEQNDDLALD
jgi:hypothetical protein